MDGWIVLGPITETQPVKHHYSQCNLSNKTTGLKVISVSTEPKKKNRLK